LWSQNRDTPACHKIELPSPQEDHLMKKEVFKPLGFIPLSKAVRANGLLYLSGEVSIDWSTRETVTGDIKIQTRQTLENIKTTLESVGSSLDKVVKTTVFLTNIQRDFEAMNEVYAEFFPSDPPARSTVGVAGLARKELIVEIELMALP
jgi:2-iminobutanoate/2-iminopropanoate deaminase